MIGGEAVIPLSPTQIEREKSQEEKVCHFKPNTWDDKMHCLGYKNIYLTYYFAQQVLHLSVFQKCFFCVSKMFFLCFKNVLTMF